MTPDEILKILHSIGTGNQIGHIKLDARFLPYINITFSNAGEDLLIRQFMKQKLHSQTPGFYVDIGAYNPIIWSNTFLYYCAQWRGICVDANQAFAEHYAKIRPRDIFINAAVASTDTQLYFGHHKTRQGMSKVSSSLNEFDEQFNQPTPVPILRLGDILDQHVPPNTEIDFMSMDIEGSELSALQSHTWERHRPRVILVEAHAFDINTAHDFPTVAFLRSKGYRFHGYAEPNVLMIDECLVSNSHRTCE